MVKSEKELYNELTETKSFYKKIDIKDVEHLLENLLKQKTILENLKNKYNSDVNLKLEKCHQSIRYQLVLLSLKNQ